MKLFLLFVLYGLYFIYGFLFLTFYIGGSALLELLRREEWSSMQIVRVSSGLALSAFLFVSTFKWFFLRGTARRIDYVATLIFMIVCPILIPVFWLGFSSDYDTLDILQLSMCMVVAYLPLLLCMFLHGFRIRGGERVVK